MVFKYSSFDTQMLQSFHKAKSFKGSPMKAVDLATVRGKDSSGLVFDPRPEHLRKCPSNASRFRNMCINYSHMVSAK